MDKVLIGLIVVGGGILWIALCYLIEKHENKAKAKRKLNK
jgi:hypothetical protein